MAAKSAPIRFRSRRAQRRVLTVIVLSPLAVLTLLCVWMYYALNAAPYMNEPPRGAGAGHTGMSNEYMHGGTARPEAPAAPAATGSTGPAPTGNTTK